MLRLQKYHFDLDFEPGKRMVVSDVLSRAHLDEAKSEIPESEMELYVHSIITNLPVSEQRWKQLQSETVIDSTLQMLKGYILYGWPSTIDSSLKPYFSFRDEICYHDGALLKGQRLIIPSKMRAEIKSIPHQGHIGISRTKSNARNSVYWPNINVEIVDMISNCSTCTDNRNSQQRETLIPHVKPDLPWEKVGIDLFTLFNKDYVLIVDYYSKFFEISKIPDKESPTVITHLKSIFSRQGIPKEVISDKGPEFSSSSFSAFAQQWDFKHNPSRPRYPQSNGLIERTIQTVKKTLRKAFQSGDDMYLSILALRTTPSKGNNESPAYMLMKRNQRTLLPCLAYTHHSKSEQRLCLSRKLSYTKQYYNEHSKDLPPLSLNDTVRIRNKDDWISKGTVIKKCAQPRSYEVLPQKGTILRRNRRHPLKTNEPFEKNCAIDYDDIIVNDHSQPKTNVIPASENIQPSKVPGEQMSSRQDKDTIRTQHYKTRSGRVVRQPNKLNL